MDNKIIGKFYAKTFGNTIYEFIVKDNGRIYCDMFNNHPIYRIVIKPRFMLFGDNNIAFLSPATNLAGLVERYFINEQLFEYLKINNMIAYSTDMAYLYNFTDKNGYDKNNHRRAFKHIQDKEKILTKQKRGIYN